MVSLSMPLSDPWPGFQASRGFVSYSWAFLFDNCYVVDSTVASMRRLRSICSTRSSSSSIITRHWELISTFCSPEQCNKSMSISGIVWHVGISYPPLYTMCVLLYQCRGHDTGNVVISRNVFFSPQNAPICLTARHCLDPLGELTVLLYSLPNGTEGEWNIMSTVYYTNWYRLLVSFTHKAVRSANWDKTKTKLR